MTNVDLRLDARWVLPIAPPGLLDQHSVMVSQGRIVAIVPSKDAERDYAAVFDSDVGLTSIRSRDHGAAGNDGVEPHSLIPCAARVPSVRAEA